MGHHWAFVGHYCAFARALQTQGEADDFRKLNPKSFGGRVDKGWVSNSGTLHHNPNHFMEGLWCRSGKHSQSCTPHGDTACVGDELVRDGLVA